MKRLGVLINLIMTATLLAACATPTPKVIEKVVTQVAKETVKETVIVEGTPQIVEKEVTKIIEKVVTATPEPEEEKPDTVVIIGVWQVVDWSNVLYVQGGGSLSAAKLTQRGLLFLDEESNWVGELATEVPSLENGGIFPDGKKITYHLREGVTWHDGEPVTSADVKATWEVVMNPNNAVITRFGYDKIESVETPDDLTVVLNFREPFASWQILFDGLVAKHVVDAIPEGELDESEAMLHPTGFGPYKMVNWEDGQFIEYEAFEDYWQGAPNIKRLVLAGYPSVDALMQAIEAGEVDIGWALPLSFVPKLQEIDTISIVSLAGASSERYTMNPDDPLFADKTVRHALQYAVDRQAIVDNLLFSTTVPAVSHWHNSPWENPDLVPYEYDPDKTREMLESVGWKDEDGDGIREAHGVPEIEDGTPFSFVHMTTVGNLQRENVQLMVQQMFKDVGVEMVIENLRPADLFGGWDSGGRWVRGDFQMGGWSHGLRRPDPDISNRFLCSEVASEENPAGAQWHRYCNPEVDELLVAQAQEFDPEERKQIFYQVQETLHDEAYWIMLFGAVSIYTVNNDLKNVVLHPWCNYYWNPQEWDW